MDAAWSKFSEYGLIGLVVGILFFILWRMLIWVMAFVKETIAQHNQERDCWAKRYDAQGKLIAEMHESLKRHDEHAEERGKYVREEHKQMIEVLGRINGYKHA